MRHVTVSRSVHRILVVANETVSSDVLHAAIRDAVMDLGSARVAVVSPALNSRVRHWLSDEDAARTAAVRRLQTCLERLAFAGISAEGYIGDADPLLAIEDTLRFFPAGRLIVATHPDGESNWLARDLVTKAETRFGMPVTHVVVGGRSPALAA